MVCDECTFLTTLRKDHQLCGLILNLANFVSDVPWIISWEIWLPEPFPANGLHHVVIATAKTNIWRCTRQLLALCVSINDLSGVSPFEYVVSEMLLTFCHGLLGCKNWVPFEYHWHQWKSGILNLWEDVKQKKADCGVFILMGLFVCVFSGFFCFLVGFEFLCLFFLVCLLVYLE